MRLIPKSTSIMLLFWVIAGSVMAHDIDVKYNGNKADIRHRQQDSITVSANGANVIIENRYRNKKITIRMSGKSDDGSLKLVSEGKVLIEMAGLNLCSKEGAPLWLKNKRKVEISPSKGTDNTLTIAACQDTASHKSAAIWAKENILFSGKGKLSVIAEGDGCRGIVSKKDISIRDLTLHVITQGNHLGRDDSGFPHPMGGMPFGEGFDGPPDFDDFPGPSDFGGFPGPPEGMHPDGPLDFGDFPGLPDGMMEFMGGDPDEPMRSGGIKQRYISPAKAIKAKHTITIHSGHVYCKTSSLGAEGMEGKKGVTVHDGTVIVDAVDDAINANGPIVFNGGHVMAESHCNDGVDANPEGGMPPFFGQPASEDSQSGIFINGGEVFAFSHVGAPEEGFDSDFIPIAVNGGLAFSIGAGMGEMPSVPSEQTAKQPTVLLVGLHLMKNEVLLVKEGKKTIGKMNIPFSFRNSSSLLTHACFKKGHTYTISTQDDSRTFTFDSNFIISRK